MERTGMERAGMSGLALITGGAIRLGRAIALKLAGEGFRIACHYRGSEAAATELRALIRGDGGTCEIFAGDLAEPGAGDRLFDAVEAAMGVPDILVNNASRFVNDSQASFDEAGLASHMAVNLTAPVVLARRLHAAAEAEAEAEGRTEGKTGGKTEGEAGGKTEDSGAGAGPGPGRDRLVVNMLDAKLFQLTPDFFTYTLSKHALLGATETMAIGFAPRVRVVGIAPSITLISGKQSQATFERSKVLTLLKRAPEPDDIARSVLFAWATKAMTGQVLVLDGGQRLMNLPRDVAFYVKEGEL